MNAIGTVRRLYLYGACLVGIGLLATGAHQLLSMVLEAIVSLAGSRPVVASALRQDAAVALSLIIVGGPIWLGHWLFVQRGLRGDHADAVAERRSSDRAAYFALVQLVSLSVAMVAAVDLVRGGLHALLGLGPSLFGGEVTSRLSMLAVGAAIWGYHARLRSGELRTAKATGAAAWLPRLYRYYAALSGLLLALGGATIVLVTLVSELIEPALGSGWRLSLADGLTMIIVGGAVWLVHVADADAAARDAGLIGEDEHRTRLRATYFGLLVLIGVAAAAYGVLGFVGGGLTLLLGIEPNLSFPASARTLLGNVIYVLPLAVAGGLHYRQRVGELRTIEPVAEDEIAPRRLPVQRMAIHIGALVGLAFLAGGAYRLIEAVLHGLVGGAPLHSAGLAVVVDPIALLAAGLLLWLPTWHRIGAWWHAEPGEERRSPASRIYLYLVVGAGLIVTVPSLAVIVFRVLDALLGGGVGDMVETLATPVSVVLVAGTIALYHGLLLRETTAMPEPAATPSAAATDAVPAPLAEAVPAPLAVALLLRAPVGTDLAATLEALRGVLPAGVTLEGDPAGGVGGRA